MKEEKKDMRIKELTKTLRNKYQKWKEKEVKEL